MCQNIKHIPANVRDEKIAKRLCYYCDQPYDRNHKCQFKEPHIFIVEISNSEDKISISEEEDEDSEEEGLSYPVILVSETSGNQNFQTTRVKGMVNKR